MIRICPSRITFFTDMVEVVWSIVVGLSCTKIAVRERSPSTVMVRGLSVFPSLHWKKLNPPIAEAVSFITVPSWNVPAPITLPIAAFHSTVTVKLIASNSAVRVVSLVKIIVRSALISPSLHCTKRKWSLGVAVIVTLLPSWKIPPPVTEPCSALQLTVTVKLIASNSAVRVVSLVKIIVRSALISPSLHCTKRKWSFGVAVSVTVLPSWKVPPPVTEP